MSEDAASGNVSVETLAKLLDLTPQRIAQLVQAGVIPKTSRGVYPLVPAVQGYCRHMRQLVTGGAGNAGLAVERTNLARAQTERIQMENALRKGELAPLEIIVTSIGKSAAQACDVLDGIPLAIKRRAPDVDHRFLKVVEEEIYRARLIAAGAKVPESLNGSGSVNGSGS